MFVMTRLPSDNLSRCIRSLMDSVQQLMVSAKAWAPDDTDVLVVLGVVYNGNPNLKPNLG